MKKALQLVVWILVLQFIGYGMGMITQANLDPWYLSLYKSPLTPPGFVFGIVWGILYVVLAIIGWELCQDKKAVYDTPLRISFGTQLILNWLWTPLFFYFHWTGIALVCLITIVIVTTQFLMLAWCRTRLLFWLILPYWIWVCFASYLNLVIWLGN